jgi:hypothetical protein
MNEPPLAIDLRPALESDDLGDLAAVEYDAAA